MTAVSLRAAFAAWLVACAPACSDEERGSKGADASDGGVPPPTRYGLEASVADSTITLSRNGVPLIRLPAGGLALGRLPAVSDDVSHDPAVFVGIAGAEPAGLEWLPVARTELTAESSTGVTALLTYDAALTAELSIREVAPGRFSATLTPTLGAESVAYFRLGVRVDAGEGFYGLGEYFDAVNHRGKVRAMQLELDLGIESSYNEAHVPVPLVVGTRGWGLFVESQHPAVFDVATAEPDLVSVTVGTGLRSSQGLSFHLLLAETALDVTKHYYELTGYPVRPARWALGPLVWRDENRDQAEVMADLDTMRDLDLATTGIWIDRPYATGVNTFDFDATRFPDPAAMIRHARDLGFRVSLWHTPYLDEGDPSTQPLRDEATARGFYPPASGILFNGWGRPIDFTNAEALAWWQGLVRRYTELGIEGFKLDYAEDVVVGLGGTRSVWEFADGTDERTMHAGYQSLYHRAYAETLPEAGGFLLCRAGTYGDQTRASVIWPGDLDATMARHRETATDRDGSTYVSVGGLPASVIAGLSLGPSGFPLFGADTGGYRHSPPDQETFMRWFEQTALSTVMQVGTSSNTVAWELAENGFDETVLEAYRRYTRLHLRLWPYVWTHVERLREHGRPIARALGLAHPELGEHPDDTYLLGDDLLVAPVVERGATSRDVSFPAGTWVDWWTGAAHQGPGHETVPAPLDVLPLFVRAGGIVPMLRPTIDAIAETTAPDRVDSYATTPGVLYARVAPGPASRFVVFDGTELAQESAADELTLSSREGDELRSGVLFEVIGWQGAPSRVVDGGETLGEAAALAALESRSSGWAYDASATGGTLHVKVPGGDHDVRVTR